jgi:hypothetical protein
MFVIELTYKVALAEIDARMAAHVVEEDLFYEHGLADFRIIEFRASQRADDIQKRIERP